MSSFPIIRVKRQTATEKLLPTEKTPALMTPATCQNFSFIIFFFVETEPSRVCEVQKKRLLNTVTLVTYVQSCVPCGRMDFNSVDFCSLKAQF